MNEREESESSRPSTRAHNHTAGTPNAFKDRESGAKADGEVSVALPLPGPPPQALPAAETSLRASGEDGFWVPAVHADEHVLLLFKTGSVVLKEDRALLV